MLSGLHCRFMETCLCGPHSCYANVLLSFCFCFLFLHSLGHGYVLDLDANGRECVYRTGVGFSIILIEVHHLLAFFPLIVLLHFHLLFLLALFALLAGDGSRSDRSGGGRTGHRDRNSSRGRHDGSHSDRGGCSWSAGDLASSRSRGDRSGGSWNDRGGRDRSRSAASWCASTGS